MLRKFCAAALAAITMGSICAGPVILGGDDLNDHGSWSGTANIDGWLYIQNALSNLVAQSTYPSNDGTIVVLGAAPSTSTGGDSCGAVYWPGQALTPSRTVTCINTAASITTYLSGLAAGTNRPLVIVYPGDGAGNGVDSAEEAAWAAGATAISNYVAAGGGLLGHTGSYTWLATLVPGITLSSTCEADPGATLTAAGASAFPTITNANINTGPCHNTFGGTFGGLQVLANDGSVPPRPFILGGGATTTFVAQAQTIPTLSAFAGATLVLSLGVWGGLRLRRGNREA